jgi:hypothetical protein
VSTGTVWLLLAAALVLLSAAIPVLGPLLARSPLRCRRRVVTCPLDGRPVLCEAVQDVRTGEWVDVRKCWAF